MPNRLKEFRERAGLTQSELAAQVGCGWQHISRMETGERGFSRKWAVKIAEVLRVNWAILMDEPLAGFADAPAAPLAPPSPDHPPVDMDDALATVQEAVAAALAERDMPRRQSDIIPIARAVLREINRLDGMQRFPATLDLRLSEKLSELQRIWRAAKASL